MCVKASTSDQAACRGAGHFAHDSGHGQYVRLTNTGALLMLDSIYTDFALRMHA